MPKANPNNPYHCDRPMRRNGKQKLSGSQQYRCKCGFTCTDSDRPVGGQIKGDRKMTQAELTERWKLNDPEGYKKSRRKKDA
jgi:hypothetical protein